MGRYPRSFELENVFRNTPKWPVNGHWWQWSSDGRIYIQARAIYAENGFIKRSFAILGLFEFAAECFRQRLGVPVIATYMDS